MLLLMLDVLLVVIMLFLNKGFSFFRLLMVVLWCGCLLVVNILGGVFFFFVGSGIGMILFL